MKIRLVGAELFHARLRGGRPNMTMLIVAFRNLAKAPTNTKNTISLFYVDGNLFVEFRFKRESL
jgi:hypothetical protein